MIVDKKYVDLAAVKSDVSTLGLPKDIEAFVVSECDRVSAGVAKHDEALPENGKKFAEVFSIRLMVSVDDFQTLIHLHPVAKD